MKYKIIRIADEPNGKTREFIDEVEGEDFLIPGWEEFKFFKRVEIGIIIISEFTTGMQVGGYYENDAQAQEDIRSRLAIKGREAVREHIAQNQISNKVNIKN